MSLLDLQLQVCILKHLPLTLTQQWQQNPRAFFYEHNVRQQICNKVKPLHATGTVGNCFVYITAITASTYLNE